MNFARLSRNWGGRVFYAKKTQHYGLLFGGAFIIATAGKSKELEINGQIRDREVRLIGADGEQKGVVSIQVAMRAAEDAGLDLVKIAPQAVPPVCKVLDYGKYRFEQQKKEKEAKKNQKVVEVKETRLSLNIDTNDFNTKVNQAAKFLQQGHKLKVSIRFRGREMAHTSLGLDVHKRFAEALEGKAVIDKQLLIAAIKRVALVAERNAPIRMVFSGQELTLSAGTADEAQAKEILDIDMDGEDITVAFQPHPIWSTA